MSALLAGAAGLAAGFVLALLAEAERQLSDRFASLSSEALARNNERFLELASATLATARQEATGDLEHRRQAVEHLVGPLRDALVKVEGQMRSLESARVEAY